MYDKKEAIRRILGSSIVSRISDIIGHDFGISQITKNSPKTPILMM